MKLSSITIQGMHNVKDRTYNFDQFNYLYGANGAGKSTVMQAIQLALLGYIPGTAKRKDDIFKHCNGHQISVTLNIDNGADGIGIHRSWTRKGKDIITEVETIPEDYDITSIIGGLSLPVLDFNEFIGMTSNKLKDWFINFLPSVDSEIKWNEVLNSAISGFGKIFDTEFVEQLIMYANSLESTGVNQIREFHDYLKQYQSATKTEVDRLLKTIQSLVFYDDCNDSETVDCIIAKSESLIKRRDEVNRLLDEINRNAVIEKQIAALGINGATATDDESYQFNKDSLNEITAQITSLRDEINGLSQQEAVLNQQLKDKESVIKGGGVCPYTKTVCDAIAEMVAVFKKDVERLKIELQCNTDNYQQKNADMRKLRSKQEDLKSSVALIEDKYRRKTELTERLAPLDSNLSKENLGSELTEIDDKRELYSDTITKLKANAKYTELIDKLTTDKFMLEQRVEIIKAWIKLTDVNGLQSQVMNKPFESIAEHITYYLGMFFDDGIINRHYAKFHLAGKANSFSLGIETKDRGYIPFELLSSGEKCLFTLALMLSIVESSDTQLPLILVDDLTDHLDKSRIDTMFDVLYRLDGFQVIMAGVQECNHESAKDIVIYV